MQVKCERVNSNIFLAPRILYNIQYLLHDRFPWKKMKIKRKPIFYLERRIHFTNETLFCIFSIFLNTESLFSTPKYCYVSLSCHVMSYQQNFVKHPHYCYSQNPNPRFCVTPWTVAHQGPLSVGFSRQEYWSGLPCPPPGDLPDTGTKPTSLISPALAGGFFTPSTTWEALIMSYT